MNDEGKLELIDLELIDLGDAITETRQIHFWPQNCPDSTYGIGEYPDGF